MPKITREERAAARRRLAHEALIPVEEAAHLLAISADRCRRLCCRGIRGVRLDAIKTGEVLATSREAVARYQAEAAKGQAA